MPHCDNEFYVPEDAEIVTLTVEQKLIQIGANQPIVNSSVFGNVDIQHTCSVTDAVIAEARHMATGGQTPVDENGLGYQFDLTDPEV